MPSWVFGIIITWLDLFRDVVQVYIVLMHSHWYKVYIVLKDWYSSINHGAGTEDVRLSAGRMEIIADNINQSDSWVAENRHG